MNTSLLADARAELRRIGELMQEASDRLNDAENAPAGRDHIVACTILSTTTVQLRTRAHALATYVQAAAAVR